MIGANGQVPGVEDIPPRPLAAERPNAGDQRIISLDFIRGIAVMGILLANIAAFGQPLSAAIWPGAFLTPDGDPDGWMWIAQFVLIDGKMRGLFTILFGAGMVLFLDRAYARGANAGLQLRRLGWLLLFGLAHYFLLWEGDILTLYALCGAVAMVMVDAKPRVQLVMGLGVYCTGAVLWTAMMASIYMVMNAGEAAHPAIAGLADGFAQMKTGPLADDRVEAALIQGGSWLAIIRHRFDAHGLDWFSAVFQSGWETIPLMWIGMALYRLGLFDGGFNARKQALWGWIALGGGTIATLAVALWVKAEGFSYFGTLTAFVGPSMFTRLPAIIGLAALLALWTPGARGWLGQRIVAAGRMAFSNYIGTSIVMMVVFSGWGLGLFGQLNRPQLYLVVLAAWTLMLAWSKPWLKQFRYGPLEWLWRCLTYWQIFPLRRQAA